MFDISIIAFFDLRTLLGTFYAITFYLTNLPIVDFALDVIQYFTLVKLMMVFGIIFSMLRCQNITLFGNHSWSANT
jgi:hypothetical protein